MRMTSARTIFVTGTDTSVGKTAVTALLLAHAQGGGVNVRALKPFSTGGTSDEALLGALQRNSLPINFFHYAEPIAPWAAARKRGETVALNDALRPIQEQRLSCELLLVEGAGGVLTPLGHEFTAADLITELQAEVIVVAANRLGVLNHTMLTVETLRNRGLRSIRIALVEHAGADASRKTNMGDLNDLLRGIPVINIPFLENYRTDADYIRAAARQIGSVLEDLLGQVDYQAKKNALDTEAEGTFP
jgi:dethiobiotin synthetase